jgi:hypothetical protein
MRWITVLLGLQVGTYAIGTVLMTCSWFVPIFFFALIHFVPSFGQWFWAEFGADVLYVVFALGLKVRSEEIFACQAGAWLHSPSHESIVGHVPG